MMCRRITRDSLPFIGFLYRAPECLLALAKRIIRDVSEEGITEGQHPTDLFGPRIPNQARDPERAVASTAVQAD
jgi:hypothetical protein